MTARDPSGGNGFRKNRDHKSVRGEKRYVGTVHILTRVNDEMEARRSSKKWPGEKLTRKTSRDKRIYVHARFTCFHAFYNQVGNDIVYIKVCSEQFIHAII